ncbi:hypothetical protein L292_2707 [Acinetobacter junii CIP 107470 = MTCC 11364]|uniref:Uncharacterized protein n=1 Tax=Acinetobacter junii CIP 107470 = MTCC 11364 TaxID=1217666 RepID=S7WSZ5_ACIJU|nr:hypothetical protein L292_2707 [Acinetobacter junii CIP 107470 = MTCC 11364]
MSLKVNYKNTDILLYLYFAVEFTVLQQYFQFYHAFLIMV